MDISIRPSPIAGSIRAIPSKSHAHRLLICAAFADRETTLQMGAGSEDIDATARCLTALGARIARERDAVTVVPAAAPMEDAVLDCGESGSTFRFLLPVAAAAAKRTTFTGRGRLPERPIGELMQVLRAHGAAFSAEKLPFSVTGKLTGGRYALPGNVSSQYITGLLLALPLVKEDSEIALTTALESKPYVDMTLNALSAFRVRVETRKDGYGIAGNQKYVSPGRVQVEGDWSNAAFFLCAGALGAGVEVTGLNLFSAQGDKAILEYLTRFGARVERTENAVRIHAGTLRGCEIDVGDTPDLVPALSAMAACAEGETRLVNAARLRLTESDRLHACAALIEALGGRVRENPDSLVIAGGGLNGGTVNSFRDHRIAMAAAVAAIRCKNEVRILGAEAANKSYPAFFEDYAKLGGTVNVVDIG